MFEAVYGKGVMTGGFSLHFVDGGFKFRDGEWYIGFLEFMYSGGESVHDVLSPVVVDRDVRFVGGRKGILPTFIDVGFGKLEGSGLVFSWVGGVGGSDMILKVLASEDRGRPSDVKWIKVINCTGGVVWWSCGDGGVEGSL